MEGIIWVDKMTNEEFAKDSEYERVFQKCKHCWIDHLLRHGELLQEIVEDVMTRN